MHAGCSRFGCGDCGRTLDRRRVPGRCFAEWNGENRAVTVNDIEAEDQRNLQTRLGNRDSLQLICSLRAADVQGGTEQTLPRQLEMFGAEVAVGFAVELLQLTKFFL